MPGFKSGPVPTPDYESNNNINQYSDVTEFIDDVYIYGTLYADISASDIDFGDSVNFKNVSITDSLNVSGITNFTGDFDVDYLTVRHEFNVGTSGTVFVAISSCLVCIFNEASGSGGLDTEDRQGKSNYTVAKRP